MTPTSTSSSPCDPCQAYHSCCTPKLADSLRRGAKESNFVFFAAQSPSQRVPSFENQPRRLGIGVVDGSQRVPIVTFRLAGKSDTTWEQPSR